MKYEINNEYLLCSKNNTNLYLVYGEPHLPFIKCFLMKLISVAINASLRSISVYVVITNKLGTLAHFLIFLTVSWT